MEYPSWTRVKSRPHCIVELNFEIVPWDLGMFLRVAERISEPAEDMDPQRERFWLRVMFIAVTSLSHRFTVKRWTT